MSHSEILSAISKYATAYENLHRLQDTLAWIPGGDQKTGCIGEYYAFLYLLQRWGEDRLSYGSHSEKGWDIRIAGDPPTLVQVKTVSAFSKTRTISPIHQGWDELYIIYLSREMEPEGFWIIEDKDIFNGQETISSAKCRKPTSPATGSKSIPFGQNRVDDLVAAVSWAANQ